MLYFMGPVNWLSQLPFSFVVIKIILGVNLITYATRRQAGMDEREAADVVNNFGRDAIGEGEDERVSAVPSTLFGAPFSNFNRNITKT
jgi:hypothetical protein